MGPAFGGRTGKSLAHRLLIPFGCWIFIFDSGMGRRWRLHYHLGTLAGEEFWVIWPVVDRPPKLNGLLSSSSCLFSSIGCRWLELPLSCIFYSCTCSHSASCTPPIFAHFLAYQNGSPSGVMQPKTCRWAVRVQGAGGRGATPCRCPCLLNHWRQYFFPTLCNSETSQTTQYSLWHLAVCLFLLLCCRSPLIP